jgi:4-alpha-glucanotransferase
MRAMHFERSSGILLHPTSLAGPFGIGDLGPEAHRWVDWLAETGCRYWQLLPLGPTGYADSPYASFSAFAGNPNLISPELLVEDGLIDADDLEPIDDQSERVHYGQVIPWKRDLVDRAYEGLKGSLHTEFIAFRNDEARWLDEFSLFMTIKEDQGGGSWVDWPELLRHRDEDTLNEIRDRHAGAVEREAFRQFVFFRQWQRLHDHATAAGIKIIGDIPLFVAHDSADVWVHPELFAIDPVTSQPTLIAGVPPDMFSDTGQRWGNPHYRWDVHAASGYRWWTERLRAMYRQIDVLRIDHFTGFAQYWEIPADLPTAEIGTWIEGPGAKFFAVMQDRLGDLPIIAEDLGPLDDPVEALRRELGLPGMKLLQEAFDGDPANMFHPNNYAEDFVVYTGTHDSDTALGRFNSDDDDYRRRALELVGGDADEFAWNLIAVAWESVAVMAVAQLQDFLSLGSEARMNFPSTTDGNWQWRMKPGVLTTKLAERIHDLNERTGRLKGS